MALPLSTANRKDLADKNQAMPDGSFPIRNTSDLANAIKAFGLSKNKAAAKAWIIKRAVDLNAVGSLPDGWAPVVKHNDSIQAGEEYLEHHGILGMHWGKRKDGGLQGSNEKPRKQTGKERDTEIFNARARQTVRAAALQGKAAATYTATTKKGAEAAQRAYDVAHLKLIANPDADTANKMTRGEKVATTLTVGGLALSVIAIGAHSLGH